MVDKSQPARTQKHVTDAYNFLGIIGQGTFGVVYKCTNKRTGHVVAIKRLKNTQVGEDVQELTSSSYREMALLTELDHPNIVRLTDIYADPPSSSIFLVFEYADMDLAQMIKYHRARKRQTRCFSVKSVMWQLVEGMAYLHSNWIMHRDLKPNNILVSVNKSNNQAEQGRVKIADFGLARVYQSPLQPLSDNGVVVTIHYRAPELLLHTKHYTKAVDMWSLGCIFAELLIDQVLFRGREVGAQNEFQSDQLHTIVGVLGTPTLQEWSGLAKLEHYKKVQEWTVRECRLANVLRLETSSPEYDLIKSMLTYDPMKRITAEEALKHRYFTEGPDPIVMPPSSSSSAATNATNCFVLKGKPPINVPMAEELELPNKLKPLSREHKEELRSGITLERPAKHQRTKEPRDSVH